MFFARLRVLETKRGGVQGLAAKRIKRGFLRLRKMHGAAFHARAIKLIAQNRVADMRHMHPNLMRPTGLQLALNQAHLPLTVFGAIAFQPPIMRHRMARFV